MAVPVAERRVVVEVPEALPPEAAELLPETVEEERRVVPDCWAEERLAELPEFCTAEEDALPLLRETLLPEVLELRRVWSLCVTAEELLRDGVAAAELRDTEAAEDRETLEEDAEPDVAELPLVLEDLVAELPEDPVALRLACAFNASGVNAIAIARTVTIRDLTKVFIRLIDIIFFGD